MPGGCGLAHPPGPAARLAAVIDRPARAEAGDPALVRLDVGIQAAGMPDVPASVAADREGNDHVKGRRGSHRQWPSLRLAASMTHSQPQVPLLSPYSGEVFAPDVAN